VVLRWGEELVQGNIVSPGKKLKGRVLNAVHWNEVGIAFVCREKENVPKAVARCAGVEKMIVLV
jgi:hypothetical protein